jgi:tight adherence protein B
MSPDIVRVLVFLTVSLSLLGAGSLIYHTFFRYRILLARRLQSEFNTQGETARLFKDVQQWEGAPVRGVAGVPQLLAQALSQSGMSMSIPALLIISGICGLLTAFVAMIVSGIWWLAAVASVPGLLAPTIFVFVRRRARQRKLCRQLPGAFEMMSRAVRVGQTASSAMQLVGEEFDSPIADEFNLCCQQQQLGISPDIALRNLAGRNGVMELRIFVMGMLVQNRTGGNLSELLDKLATIVRNRLKLQAKVKAVTGEGRMQAVVLMLLPVIALLALFGLSPEYVVVFFERPWILGCVAMAHGVAALWIRSIVKFDA